MFHHTFGTAAVSRQRQVMMRPPNREEANQVEKAIAMTVAMRVTVVNRAVIVATAAIAATAATRMTKEAMANVGTEAVIEAVIAATIVVVVERVVEKVVIEAVIDAFREITEIPWIGGSARMGGVQGCRRRPSLKFSARRSLSQLWALISTSMMRFRCKSAGRTQNHSRVSRGFPRQSSQTLSSTICGGVGTIGQRLCRSMPFPL